MNHIDMFFSGLEIQKQLTFCKLFFCFLFLFTFPPFHLRWNQLEKAWLSLKVRRYVKCLC